MRVQLDRRARVFDTVVRNEEHLAYSAEKVARSRSPVKRVVTYEPLYPVPPPVVHYGAPPLYTTYGRSTSPLLRTPLTRFDPPSPAPAATE